MGRLRARAFGVVALTVAIALFAVSLILIELRLQVLSSTVDSGSTEASWNAFQARFELERLLHALDADGKEAAEPELASYPV